MPTRHASRAQFDGAPYVTGHVALKLFTTSGTTNTSGGITFGIPVGTFTTVYFAQATAVRNTASAASACFALVRSVTASTVVVQVFESATTGILLGGTVEGLEATTTATTVLLQVVGL